MTHYDWNSLPAEQLNPLITRRAVHTQNMTIARLEIRKDAVVPEHQHVHEQVATVERLDIVHAHYAIPHAVSAYLAREALGPTGAPKIVTTLHGTDVSGVGTAATFRPMTRLAIERTDGLRGLACGHSQSLAGIGASPAGGCPVSDAVHGS